MIKKPLLSIAIATALTLPAAAYDDSWTIDLGWGGEYPDGFTVLEEGVTVKGRILPYKHLQTQIECELPVGANIHQWNHERVESDNLKFVSATESVPLVIFKDGSIEVEGEYEPVKIGVMRGQTIRYLRYFGEGFGQIEVDGTAYTAELGQLDALTAFPKTESALDEWVRVTCSGKNGEEAWLLLDEVRSVDGVGMAKITGYGESEDLTDKEVESGQYGTL